MQRENPNSNAGLMILLPMPQRALELILGGNDGALPVVSVSHWMRAIEKGCNLGEGLFCN